MMAGISATPASSGPKLPIKEVPIQAPIMPTMAEAKNPPGIDPGTIASAIHAHTAATIKNKMNPRMLMFSSNLFE